MGIVAKIKPKSGFSHFFHIGLNALLPALLFVLIRMGFVPLAASLIVLAKWRMFTVRPRYWPANFRSNGVDMIVGFAAVIFMANSTTAAWQLVWAVAYAIWLIIIKPGSSIWKTSIQALIAQTAGLMALFIALGDSQILVLVILSWMICYSVARHFFTSFEEPYTSLYAHTWGYFAAALVWLLSHWLIFYGIVAQVTLLLTVIGFGLAALFYLEQTDRLSMVVRRNFVVMMVAIVLVIVLLSDWGGKTI
jgi:hypothetical protein